MHDKDGKPVGVLAHEIKTHTSNSNYGEMIVNLHDNIEDIKIDDKFSNEDVISYTMPQNRMNKDHLVSSSMEVATNINKISNSADDEGKADISAFPETSDTGLMDE